MKESLKSRIYKYLQKRDYFVASGDIQRLAQENGYYSPQNSGRRLRELCEEGKIEVEYRKNHAWYRRKSDIIKHNEIYPEEMRCPIESDNNQIIPQMSSLFQPHSSSSPSLP